MVFGFFDSNVVAGDAALDVAVVMAALVPVDEEASGDTSVLVGSARIVVGVDAGEADAVLSVEAEVEGDDDDVAPSERQSDGRSRLT